MEETKAVYRYDQSPDFERWAQVAFLYPRVMAALPESHACRVAFAAFKAAEEASDNDMDCIRQDVLHTALAAYRKLSGEERAGVMSGWRIEPYFPSRRDVLHDADYGNLSVNCAVIQLSEAANPANLDCDVAFPNSIAGDSNLPPVSVTIVAGTSREIALRCLERARAMVDRCWSQISSNVTVVSSDCGDAFHFKPNEKERSETAANSRPPGQLPGTKAAESTAPMSRDDNGSELEKSIREIRDWASTLVA